MSVDFQSTLFDAAPAGERSPVERRTLSSGAWVDVARGWLPTTDGSADEAFATLVRDVPWRAERRAMYDRVVDVPRLLHTYMIGEDLPHPALTAAREDLNEHYADELGERFRTAGCCYYRDGRDSVAWHGDRIGRGNTEDTMVAILSLGAPRPLMLRPVGGAQRRLEPCRPGIYRLPRRRFPDGPRGGPPEHHRRFRARDEDECRRVDAQLDLHALSGKQGIGGRRRVLASASRRRPAAGAPRPRSARLP